MGKTKPESAQGTSTEPTPKSRRGSKRPGQPAAVRPRQRKSSKPPAKKAKPRSKRPPSLPPLELSDSFLPPKDDNESGDLRTPRIPAAPPAPKVASEPPADGWASPFAEDDGFGDLDDELEARFAASLMPGPASDSSSGDGSTDPVTTDEDLDSVRHLFGEMAVPFMSQVRDFMLELAHTDASTSWIELCEPALQSLRSTCQQLETPELGRALDEYVAWLERAKIEESGRIEGEVRNELLASYRRMTEILPEAFEVEGGREPVIVELLLLQVPGVHKRTVKKLYAAGVNQLEAFLAGKPDDISAVSGIDLDVAERIVKKFQDYRRRAHSMLARAAPDEERAALSALVERLREQDAAYQRAREGWSKEAVSAKRRARRERSQIVKEIYLVLARMGEKERIEQLEKLPVSAQLERLVELLEQSEATGA